MAKGAFVRRAVRRGLVAVACVSLVPSAARAQEPTAPGVTIDHPEIGCVVAEQYPKIAACVVPDTNLAKAQVHFRGADTDPWYAVELKPDGPCYTAVLPKPTREMQEFTYYVNVMDRQFNEVRQPAAGPSAPVHVRVVGKANQCQGALSRVAGSLSSLTSPVVLSVARNAAGVVVDAVAAKSLESTLLLVGFRPEGVLLASTGLAPASAAGTAAAAGSSTSTTAAAGGGAGAGGGGIGAGTLAVAGGVAAAGAVVAASAGGGGDDSTPAANNNNTGGGNNNSNNQPAAINLTGRWQGPWVTTATASGFGSASCNFEFQMDLTHSGTSITGTGRSVSGRCSGGGFDLPIDSGQPTPLSGTASNGTITFNFPEFAAEGVRCSGYSITGTFTNSTMGGNMDISQTCVVEGFSFTGRQTGTWSARR